MLKNMLLAILLITVAQTSKTYAKETTEATKNEIGINLNSPVMFFLSPRNTSMFLGDLQYKRNIGKQFYCRTKFSYRRSNELATNKLSTYGVIDNEKIRFQDADNYYRYINSYNEQIITLGTGVEKRKEHNQYVSSFYGLDMEISRFESSVKTNETLINNAELTPTEMVTYHTLYFPKPDNMQEVTTATTRGILIAPMLFYGLITKISEKISIAANVQTNSYFYMGKLKHQYLTSAVNNTLKINGFDYSLGGSVNLFYSF